MLGLKSSITMRMYVYVLGLCMMYILSVKAQTCSGGQWQIIPKADDCVGWYICSNGVPIQMPDCPVGTVFSRTYLGCVSQNGPRDDCTKASLTIEEQCSLYGGIIPHPEECQLYYNCSHTYEYLPRYFEQHMMECTYPDLFNTETKQCEPFQNVKCGDRIEHVNGCDYLATRCGSSHCIPCYIRFPSCENRNDGIHENDAKLWSPFYVECYKQRFVEEKTCPVDANGRTQLFHPDLDACVSLDLIPQEHGGMMPDCRNKTDGYHLDDFGRCNRYDYCEGGQFVQSFTCPSDEVFDPFNGVCQSPEKACGPCGLLMTC